uniref:Uncharacterized protein n=1 Tax=Micrurus paraensis TaxID=1970185 RepID=A0A2D4K1G0_9SAUR
MIRLRIRLLPAQRQTTRGQRMCRQPTGFHRISTRMHLRWANPNSDDLIAFAHVLDTSKTMHAQSKRGGVLSPTEDVKSSVRSVMPAGDSNHPKRPLVKPAQRPLYKAATGRLDHASSFRFPRENFLSWHRLGLLPFNKVAVTPAKVVSLLQSTTLSVVCYDS